MVDRKETENNVVDHLLRLENVEIDKMQLEVNACFLDEVVLKVEDYAPWYANIVNFLVCKQFQEDYNAQQKKKLMHDSKFYYWDERQLYKRGPDHIFKLCVPETSYQHIFSQCHESSFGGHFGGQRMVAKVIQCGYYWTTLFKDAGDFVVKCDNCQHTRNISSQHETPLTSILEVELFDI